MHFLPAIDILDGRVVRLKRGDYSKVTVYNDDPSLQAQLFEEAGADWLHVVDLDGARGGSPHNIEAIANIMRKTNLHVEVGGGVRTLDDARRILDVGANRVIFGTSLVRDPDFAQAAVEEFGFDSVVAGIDAKDGDVKVEGWVQGAEISALELASRMATLGYQHLIYTDISRDGMQTGVSSSAYVEMYQSFGNPVIASGGISSLRDLQELLRVETAIEGVIAGRALYEGAFTVEDGVAVCKGTFQEASSYLSNLETPIEVKE